MGLTAKQKKSKILLELKDLITGAAFPLMLQLILSASVILFADYSGEIELQILAIVLGELMLMAAYFIFGRQNGLAAYRRTVQAQKKRELNGENNTDDLKTGEYAIWKGIVIAVISVIPFMLFQFIQCLAPNLPCEFILKYAFGWADYPFIVIGEATKNTISGWLNYIWIVIPIGIHTGAYVFGASKEAKRQKIMAQAQEIKDKRRK